MTLTLMIRAPLLRRRAANELREIEVVATQHAQRHALVPLLKTEPVGLNNLTALTRMEEPSS